MAHTAPEMDANQVPECPGALGLPEKGFCSDLGHRPFMQPLDRCVRRSPEWPQPELRRFIVKQLDQEKHEGATDQARPQNVQVRPTWANSTETRGMATTVPRPCMAQQDAHRHPVGPEPDGDPGHQRHLIDRQRDGQEDAEGQIKMPEASHAAGEHHAHDEQVSPQEHDAADAIPIPEPATSGLMSAVANHCRAKAMEIAK